MVVDCGGGTVDITVHEVSNKQGHIKEVFKATGGPYGSTSNFFIFDNILGVQNSRKGLLTSKLCSVGCMLCFHSMSNPLYFKAEAFYYIVTIIEFYYFKVLMKHLSLCCVLSLEMI